MANIVPILFLLDNIFSLNTGFYEKGILHENRGQIIKNWLKNNLWQDFISIFPLSIFIIYELGIENEE